MKLQLIDTGYFYADGGAMFGAIPRTAWQRRYAADKDNCCVLAMRTALVSTDSGKTILIDNGAGNKHLKEMSYYRFFGLKDLNDELQKAGVSPGDITDVILTHLHFDHCGYTTQRNADGHLSLAFPNATHWVSRKQWESCHNPNPLEKDSFFTENIDLTETEGKLCLLEEDTELCNGIGLRLFDGHTDGQIVVYILIDGQTHVFAGDVIPLAAHVSPRWISAYDIRPLTSYGEKLRLLEEAAADNQTVIFCHDVQTHHATIQKKNDYFRLLR